MDSTILIVVLGAAIIFLVFFRTRKGGKQTTINRRHWDEYKRAQEESGGPPEPEYHLKEVGPGGRLHLSLPKGLEEDFTVLQRDRVERHDEQIEYDLKLRGSDPDHPLWLNWWNIGIYTHAWLLEPTEFTLDRFELSTDRLAEMKAAGEGEITYRDEPYMLDIAGDWLVFESGRRPGREFRRWDFRNAKGTRSIVIQERADEASTVRIYTGQEIWLRDLTVRVASSEPEQGEPGQHETE